MSSERHKAIEAIRQKLRERRHQLVRYVANLTGSDEDDVDDPAAELRELDSGGWMMLGPLANELDRIDESLRLIREDRYGTCKSCGLAIVAERLELNPLGRLCVDCQVTEDLAWRDVRASHGPEQN